MTDSARARLRALLDAMIVEGLDVPTIRDLVAPSIPIGDAEYWMRSSIAAEVRRYCREAGLVLNHAADLDGEGLPAETWVQFTIPEVVSHIQHVAKQIADDDAALERRLEVWCDANPEAGMTPDALRTLAA